MSAMYKQLGRRALSLLMVLSVCLLPARAEEPPAEDPPAEGEAFETYITSPNMADGSLSVKAGDTEQLSVQRTDGQELTGYTLAWRSDDESIATVDEGEGLLHAHAGGKTTVHVDVFPTGSDAPASSASCTVTVSQAVVANLVLERGELTLAKDESQTLAATVTMDPASAEPLPVTWRSEDESIAKVVSDSGKVTGIKAGQTTVIATAGDREARCVVTVTGLVISPTSLSLVAGSSATITKTLYGVTEPVTYEWSSSSDNTARVDQNGKVTAGAPGTCTITVATSDGRFSATCEVKVTDNTAGSITGEAETGQPVSLSDLESEINDQCRSVLNSNLSYVTNLSVPTNQGILYYDYVSADDTGSGVGSLEKYYYGSNAKGERTISNITFLAKPDFSGNAVISYTGYNSNNQFFNGSIRIKVEAAGDVVYSTGKDTAVPFHFSDLSTVCRRENGRDLSFVTFTLPSSQYGSLYYNYGGAGQLGTAVESGTQYFRSKSPYVDNITFVPAKGYTGTVRVSYRGEDTAGGSFSGQITIYVGGNGGGSSGGGNGDISYRTGVGDPVTFRASDFNDYCRDATGYNLDYVRFTSPSSSRGDLYYDYNSSRDYGDRVSSSTSFYRNGTPSLSRVTFVPEDDYSGDVSISFTGYDVEKNRISGTVEIRVGSGGSTSGSVVTYRTDEDEAVEFNASDFNDLCRDELGVSLRYVRFSLPSSSRGELYYDYNSSRDYGSRVSASTSYYRNDTPSISRISFVPKSGYTGTVSFNFTGYDVDGDRFTGTVRVIVGGGSGSGEDAKITYRGTAGQPVHFSVSDFNDVCKDVQGASLDYVRFILPPASDGTLYYNYTSSGSYDGKVNAATSYYRSGGSRKLEEVSFVPKSNASGKVTINFNGWDVNGRKFTGVVEISVGRSESTGLRYSIRSDESLTMNAMDFNLACREATGSSLNYVRFTLPYSGQGTLHYDYGRPASTLVSNFTNYYRSGGTRQLGKVSFVPADGYSGSVILSYMGWNMSGDQFNGTLTVNVEAAPAPTPVTPDVPDRPAGFRDMRNYSWAETAVEYLYQNGVVTGISAMEFGPGQTMTRADYVLMLCRAFELNTGSASSYSDVPQDAYYAWAAATARDLGIVPDDGSGSFQPDRGVSRQDAMLYLQLTMRASGWSLPDGPPGKLAGYSDSGSISDYARGAMAAMIDLGVLEGNGSGQLNPSNILTRAEMAVLLYRALTL